MNEPPPSILSKRDYSDLHEGQVPEISYRDDPDPKRLKRQPQGSSKSRQHQNSGIDATYGQKYVFSSCDNATTIPEGEEDEFEDDADAMAYLVSVRQEAYGIPHLLVAPKVQIGPQLPAGFSRDDANKDNQDQAENEQEVDDDAYVFSPSDCHGYYEDGAYIARPEEEDRYNGNYHHCEDGEEDDKASLEAIHNAYFASILTRYHRLRSRLNKSPPANAQERLPVSALTEDHPRTSLATWNRILTSTDPLPIQISLMSKPTILRLIEILLGGKHLRMGHTLSERTSRWLWALLARLPDRGELNHIEMGWVRDLGRRAVLMGRSLSEMALLREEMGGDGVDDEDEGQVDNEVEEADQGDLLKEEDVVDEGEDEEEKSHGDSNFNAEKNNNTAGSDSTERIHQEEETKNGNDDEGGGDDDIEEGEISESESTPMDLESTPSSPATLPQAQTLEEHKARLLSYIDNSVDDEGAARERARINMRATVNMVLTVAGEMYGQRDLLEFREPFVGM